MASKDAKEIKSAIANLIDVVAYISQNSENVSVKVIRLIDVISNIVKHASKVNSEDAARVTAFKTAIGQIFDSLKEIIEWAHDLSNTAAIDIKQVTNILIRFSVIAIAVSKTSQKIQPYLADILIFADQLTAIVEKLNQLPTPDEDLADRAMLIASVTSRMLASMMSLATTIALRMPILNLLIKGAQSKQFDMLRLYVDKIAEILEVFDRFTKKNIKQIPKKMSLVRKAILELIKFIEYMASDVSLLSVLMDTLSSKPLFKLLSNAVSDIFGVFDKIIGANNWDAVLKGSKQLVKSVKMIIKLSRMLAKFGRRVDLFKGSLLLTVAKFKLLHSAISDMSEIIAIIAAFRLLDYKKVLRSRLGTLKELAVYVIDIADMLIDQKSKTNLTDIPDIALLSGIFEIAQFAIRQMITLLVEIGSMGSVINIIRSSAIAMPVLKRAIQGIFDIVVELQKIRKKLSLQDLTSLLVVATKLGVVWLAISVFMRVMEEISKFNIVRHGPIMVVKILFMRLSIKAIGLLVKTLLSLKLTAKEIAALALSTFTALFLMGVLLVFYQLFDVIARSNIKQNFIARKKTKAIKLTIESVLDLVKYIAEQVRGVDIVDVFIMLLFIPISKMLQLVLLEFYSLLEMIHGFKIIRDFIILKLKIGVMKKTLMNLNQLLIAFAKFGVSSISLSVVGLLSIIVFHILESILIRLLSILDLIGDFGFIKTALAPKRIKRIIRFVDSLNELIVEVAKIGMTLSGRGYIELLKLKFKLKVVKSIIRTLSLIRKSLLRGKGKNDERVFKRMKGVVDKIVDLVKHIIEAFNVKEMSFENLIKLQIKLVQITLLIVSVIVIIAGLMALMPLSILLAAITPFVILAIKLMVWTIKYLIKKITSIDDKQLAKAVAKITALTSSLLLIAKQLKEFIPLAAIIAPAFLAIGAVMLLILGYLALVVVFGVIVNIAKPLMFAALIGIFMLTIFTLAILAIMLIIAAIALITIDVDKIMQNIDAVFTILDHIIIKVSEPISDKIKEDPKGKDQVENKDALTILGGLVTNGLLRYVGGFIAFAAVAGAVLAVAAIGLIVLMLRGIQELDLDSKRILNNVKSVLDTVDLINNAIWDSKDKRNKKSEVDDEKKDFLTAAGDILTNFTATPLGAILSSIITAAYLVVSLISILAVFLIVLMLRGLQELDLSPEKIINNVNTVMWICHLIIESVLMPTDPTGDVVGSSKKSEIGSIMEWVAKYVPGLGFVLNIIGGVLAFAYLAVMVFTIMAVLLLVLMLRLIQTIDLNPAEINANVDMVLDTCQHIINSVFQASEPDNKASSFSIFGSLVSFIYPPLAAIINAIFAFAYLAVMAVSILMVMLLAKLLTSLANDYKLEDIILGRVLAEQILAASRAIQNAVFFGAGGSVEGKKSDSSIGQKIWDAMASFFTNIPGVKLLSALIALGNVAHMAMGILLVMMLGNLLSKLAHIDIPNIKNLGQFSRDIIAAAKETARAAFDLKFDLPENAEVIADQMLVNSILSGISRLIPGLSADLGSIKNIPSIGMIIGGIGAIKAVGIALMSLGSISISVEDVRNKLQDINTAVPFLCESLTIIDSYHPNVNRVNNNLNLIKKLHEIIPGLTHVTPEDVKNSKDLTDNYIAFLTKVNSMDFAKLKTTEQLMKHWADISRTINGNFQGLAQAINEHIMPTLKSLNKTMDESMKVQKQIIDDLSKPIDASRMVNDAPGVPPTGTPSDSGQNGAPSNTSSPDGDSSSPSYSGADYIPARESAYENTTNDFETEKEPIGDGPSFINPYVRNADKQRKSALERLTKALDGDALRVKIIN